MTTQMVPNPGVAEFMRNFIARKANDTLILLHGDPECRYYRTGRTRLGMQRTVTFSQKRPVCPLAPKAWQFEFPTPFEFDL